MTGVSDVDLAVRAMKLEAFDYLIKPVDDEKLLEVLSAAMEHGEIRQSISRLPEQLSCGDLTYKDAFRHFPTRNPEMIRLLHQAEKIASTDLSIFIWGESGTGKEAIARAIHSASPRREGPFVAADAGSRDPEKFSSFLFGQAKDWSGSREEAAGLLEQSDHGTLFLNNVDALPVPTQVRLNRVIQTGEFYRENSTQIRKADVRIIVSSSHDLTRPDYKERFSRDLLYHLMINSIQIPPLRDRVEDIPILAEYFMKEEANRIGRKVGGFSPELIDLLSGYSYPDNVQELRTIVVSAVAGADSETIGTEALPMYIRDLFRIEAAGGGRHREARYGDRKARGADLRILRQAEGEDRRGPRHPGGGGRTARGGERGRGGRGSRRRRGGRRSPPVNAYRSRSRTAIFSDPTIRTMKRTRPFCCRTIPNRGNGSPRYIRLPL